MLKKYALIFPVLITFNLCIAQNTEEVLVKKSFDNYKSAILNDRGQEAVTYVDSRTVRYYTDILQTTKNADATEINALGLMDKLMVLTIRHRATKEEILGFDGEGLLIYAIEKGMVGKNSVANNTLGTIEVEGTFAKGQLVTGGRETPLYFHFYKENGIWKIDITSVFSMGAVAFKKMQEDSGYDENEYIFALLEMLTGKKPGEDIWNSIE